MSSGCREPWVCVARFRHGPLDGDERVLFEYPDKELDGYVLSHSMNGRYYVYQWPEAARVTPGT